MAGPVRKQLITKLDLRVQIFSHKSFKSFARFFLLFFIIFLMLLSPFMVLTELRFKCEKASTKYFICFDKALINVTREC